MSKLTDAITILDDWYANRTLFQDKLPSKGTISAALIVLQRLRSEFNLDVAAHVSEQEAQIAGLSSKALASVLAEFGETRVLSSIAGRSNRGARGDISALLMAVKSLGLDELSQEDRFDVIVAMQRHIVEVYVLRYFHAKRVKAFFDQTSATTKFIRMILDNAGENGKAGPVAEYLVGAKLALLYPEISIRNKRASTSDVQLGHEGDFQVGTTVFHVTVAPMSLLYPKIVGNLENGLRVYLLVPESEFEGTKQNVKREVGQDLIVVQPIEIFVATNIDELTKFDGRELKTGFRQLLDVYNTRVDAIELDKSLLIEVPPNLE